MSVTGQKTRTSSANAPTRTPNTISPIPPDATLTSMLKDIQDESGAVRSLKEAKTYLIQNSWMLSDEDFTLERVAIVLLTLSKDDSKANAKKNAVVTRAIGFVLSDPNLPAHSNSLNDKIETLVSAAVENTVKAIETRLTTQISFLSKATSETADSLVQLKSAVSTQNDSLTRLHDLDNKLNTTAESMTSHIKSYKDALTSQPPTQGAINAKSPDTSARESAIRNRKAIQDRQLMLVFRPVSDETKAEFDKLNLDELKEKAINLVARVANSDQTSQALDI